MISEQLDREFKADNYDNLKKVYSIWICTESSEKYANTITLYSLEQKNVYGEFTGTEIYDLLSVLIVRLSGKENAQSGNGLHRMLSVLLSHTLEVEQKQEILQTEYGMVMSKDLREGVTGMCNLSLAISAEARAEGKAEGIVLSMKEMGQDDSSIIRMLMNHLSLSQDEAEAYVSGLGDK